MTKEPDWKKVDGVIRDTIIKPLCESLKGIKFTGEGGSITPKVTVTNVQVDLPNTQKAPVQMFTPRNAFGMGEHRFVVRRDHLLAAQGDKIVLCDTQGDGQQVVKTITGGHYIDDTYAEIVCE